MNKNEPSAEALAELKGLSREYGVSDELLESLKTSKKQARSHISFFKRMMFLTNGAVMTAGLALAGFGGERVMKEYSFLGFACVVVGLLVFVKFASIFSSMVRAIKATETIARRHDLI